MIVYAIHMKIPTTIKNGIKGNGKQKKKKKKKTPPFNAKANAPTHIEREKKTPPPSLITTNIDNYTHTHTTISNNLSRHIYAV